MARRAPNPAPWTKWMLLLAFAVGMSVGAAPVLFSSGANSGGDNRGDNPVVGSLPCKINKTTLEGRFWMGLGLGPPGGVDLSGVPATFGMTGPPDLAGAVIDAGGTPYGEINACSGWTCFALSTNAFAVLSRAAVTSGLVTTWEWVPPGYVGGRYVIERPSGTSVVPISTQQFPLSLVEIAAAVGNPSATVTIYPNAQNQALGTRTLRISTSGPTIRVQQQL